MALKTANFLSRFFLPKINEVMIKNVRTIEVSKPLIEAFKIVAEDDVHSVVITQDEKPIGILTRRTAIKCFLENVNCLEKPLDEVMTHNLITIDLNQNLADAYELMKNEGIKRIIVLENGRIVGKIRWHTIQLLASESPGMSVYKLGYFLLGVLTTIAIVFVFMAT